MQFAENWVKVRSLTSVLIPHFGQFYHFLTITGNKSSYELEILDWGERDFLKFFFYFLGHTEEILN